MKLKTTNHMNVLVGVFVYFKDISVTSSLFLVTVIYLSFSSIDLMGSNGYLIDMIILNGQNCIHTLNKHVYIKYLVECYCHYTHCNCHYSVYNGVCKNKLKAKTL